MKSVYFSILAIAFSITAAAQGSGVSNATMNQQAASKTKGIQAGIVYSNLTDVSAKYELDSPYSGYNDTAHGGTQLGLIGLNVGYKDKYVFGSIGFSASGTLLKPLNKSEAGDDTNMLIYKVQGDLIVPLSDAFSLVGGLNVSHFTGMSHASTTTYEPAAGADAGVQVDLKSNISILVGAQLLGMSAKLKNSAVTGKIAGFADGVLTQVSYTF